MKKCQQCGQVAQDNELFCGVCGASLSDAAPAENTPNASNEAPQAAPVSYQQPEPQQAQYAQQPEPQQPQYAQQPLYAQQPQASYGSFDSNAPRATTKKEFLNLEENKKLRSTCNAAGIICYIAAGITFILVLVTGMWTSILDVCILIGLGLGVHIAQNRACAVILLVYSIINTIYMLAAMGTFGGWLIILAGIFAVTSTFSVNKQWVLYQQQQQMTDQQQMPGQQPPYQN